MSDVLLLSMPFASLLLPSIGLSLLKTELAAAGVSVRVTYPTFQFAERIGPAFYSSIADGSESLYSTLEGEWIFSGALFGSDAPDPRRYVEEILRRPNPKRHRRISDSLLKKILGARASAEPFLDDCLDAIVREKPAIVGFTSVFQQHVASLALARRIKERLPGTFILFGGANCEGMMGAETVRRFPFVDAAVSGEGDVVVPEIVRRVLDGKPPTDLRGVWTCDSVAERLREPSRMTAESVRRMDDLPFPDYDDFVVEFVDSPATRRKVPQILFESSRGCWWGEKMHCTFCGLNGSTMAYRSKSSRRALEELLHLRREYPQLDIQVVDNILDMAYFDELLPELARRKMKLGLFYETKSNLKKEQIRLLAAADVRHIQPGIESFSDGVLKSMRKGVTALQNIQLLKWCKELGVWPLYNILWGFPGEPPDEYRRMADLVPLLAHLTPPKGAAKIHIDRFAPTFTESEKLGFVDVEPLDAYGHVYPFETDSLRNLAYFFTAAYREPQDVDRYVGDLSRAISRWSKVHDTADLFSVETGDALLLWDLRPSAVRLVTVLDGTDRLLYAACDASHDAAHLARAASVVVEEAERRLERLVVEGFALRDRGKYLALAVPLGAYSPPPAVLERFHQAVGGSGAAPRMLRPSQFSLDARGSVKVRGLRIVT